MNIYYMTKKNKKIIYFVRHGETDFNVMISNDVIPHEKSDSSPSELQLNENGMKQAELTGKYLNEYRSKSKPFTKILSSPYKRASQTSNILSKHIGQNPEIVILDELRESKMDNIPTEILDRHKYEIQSHEDPIEKYNDMNIFEWLKNNKKIVKENNISMEKSKELKKRINYVANYIKNTEDEKLIVVSHHDFLMSMLKKITDQHILPHTELDGCGNCMITRVTYDKKNKFRITSPLNNSHFKCPFSDTQ